MSGTFQSLTKWQLLPVGAEARQKSRQLELLILALGRCLGYSLTSLSDKQSGWKALRKWTGWLPKRKAASPSVHFRPDPRFHLSPDMLATGRFCKLYYFSKVFIYFWLCWVFAAVWASFALLVTKWGLLSRWGARASRCGGFSCCGPRPLGHMRSVIVAHRL